MIEREEERMGSCSTKTARAKPYSLREEIEGLVREFESCTLPRERWTHHAHLTVALWYLKRRSRAEAVTLIRDGIQRYNKASGIITTKESGYHETITRFYIWAVGKYLSSAEAGSIVELANGLIESRYADKSLPLEYYSRERLMSWRARLDWVEPDLKSLD